MRAIVQQGYGSPDVLVPAELDRPEIGHDEVLVQVMAASLHAGDALLMRGTPKLWRLGVGLRAPRQPVPGLDLAGRVAAVGAGVNGFTVGDAVFGNGRGTLAEYAAAKSSQLAPMPSGLRFPEAAVLTVSGLTALTGLRDVAKVQPGQTLLINGASGGVGVYAVQVGKALGAHVVAVCGSSNASLVQSLGADEVIDYRTTDFTASQRRYDVILDNVGNHRLRDLRRVLHLRGTLLPNSGTTGGAVLGPLPRMAGATLLSPLVKQRLRVFLSTPNQADLAALSAMVEAGQLRPVLRATYPLAEAAEAMRVVASGHPSGKVAILVGED